MDSNNILFSIITVNLNHGEGLEKTITSVRCQTFGNYELIIIDGNSKDNSFEIINNNLDIISYYVSEEDEGIYDAMNKGLEKAAGDFVIFLNSGDYFNDNDVLNVTKTAVGKLDSVYFGSAKIMNDYGAYFLYPKLEISDYEIDNFIKYRLPHHQAMFFPKIFYFNERYNINYINYGDEDYKIRAIKKYGYIYIKKIIVTFMLGGFSIPSSFKKTIRMSGERLKIEKRNNIFSHKRYILFLITLLLKYFMYLLIGNNTYKIMVYYNNVRIKINRLFK